MRLKIIKGDADLRQWSVIIQQFLNSLLNVASQITLSLVYDQHCPVIFWHTYLSNAVSQWQM
jgi:hypothetical protein